MALALALVLHAHQPAGNFDHVIEAAYRTSYQPFLAAAAERPWLRLNLHYSGFLLDWLGERHPEYLERLRELAGQGRLEVLGGGYYEPILAAIPARHQQEQLGRLRRAVEGHLGLRPRGAWLAERVWEPHLPAVLAEAGIEYTLLDDSHFLRAGCGEDELHTPWISEDQGASVRLIASNHFLRQALPFRPEEEGIGYLLEAGRRHPAGLLAMGDDLEKFGSWPHTFEHVYRDGWLQRFLDRLEAETERIETVRLSDYLDTHAARGPLYVPTGSYPEMMEWAGSASWRGFLHKYPEANLLHKTGWDLHRRLEARAGPAGPHEEALNHLLAAECNDVYWHGWFGGLYSPHLRNLAFEHLIAADRLIERMGEAAPVRRLDLHLDGGEAVEMRTPELRVVVTPADGGTIEELDSRPAAANLINSIQRRPEAYHEKLRRREEHNPAQLPGGEAHGCAATPAEWEARLVYDAHPRSSGRLYLCAAGKGFADFQGLTLDADPGASGGAYAVAAAEPGRVAMAREGIRKTVRVEGNEVEVGVEIGAGAGAEAGLVAIEMVFNLLAPDAEDRYFEQGGRRYGLRWAGELAGGAEALTLRDGWRGIGIRLEAPGADAWWVQPLYTVSQTDTGIETLYQGSAIAAVWAAGTRRASVKTKIFL